MTTTGPTPEDIAGMRAKLAKLALHTEAIAKLASDAVLASPHVPADASRPLWLTVAALRAAIDGLDRDGWTPGVAAMVVRASCMARSVHEAMRDDRDVNAKEASH